jgi:predicted dehydrogenase
MSEGRPVSGDPIRLGIIGCGKVLSGPYRPVLSGLLAEGSAELVVACDMQPEREAFVRETFEAKRFTTDHREVVAADDVDVILVLTPPSTHAALAIEALTAGKHVLVEKPVALSLDDAQHVLGIASTSPGHLVCAPFVELSPTFRAMHDIVRAGRIGKVLSARAIYGWAGPDWGPWFYRGDGGGPMFDLGVYNLTTLTGLMGPVRRVAAMSAIAIPTRLVDGAPITVEVDDNFQVLLDFGDSVFAVLTTGFTIQQLRTPAIELYASTGTIQMLGADWQPAGHELWENEIGAWTLVEETAPEWKYADGLRHLVESIRAGVPPILRPDHAVHVLEIMLLALQAGRDGRTHETTTSFERQHPSPSQEPLP